MKLLVVDNFDSFTYMLVDYLQQAGAVCRVVRNDESLSCLTSDPVDGVVLSPGPGSPKAANRLMAVIDHYHRHVPMLGVCLGHQALGEFFGATLSRASQPMHGKISTVRTLEEDCLWREVPATFEVTRYHSLVLTALPTDLIPTAVTEQNEVMAMRHRTLPLWGVQFHPEAALTQYGFTLIQNWIDFVRLTHKRNDLTTSLTAQYA
ncbi:aminodeoxychorismate/anthranilate synthase component II [Spirosoma sp.]|uniref:anthranilate synthase component II n=1 Tax=Spirosoma sp. TaxID=1899569 RepID=UPI002608CCAB|nr:aminodeoxychorismate/anthranilate synthase component II [Spirosoma sp.]MCX6217811.1 aminodeoxychorismate/anthranilate synthase component II [Spirosoma sp.]